MITPSSPPPSAGLGPVGCGLKTHVDAVSLQATTVVDVEVFKVHLGAVGADERDNALSCGDLLAAGAGVVQFLHHHGPVCVGATCSGAGCQVDLLLGAAALVLDGDGHCGQGARLVRWNTSKAASTRCKSFSSRYAFAGVVRRTDDLCHNGLKLIADLQALVLLTREPGWLPNGTRLDGVCGVVGQYGDATLLDTYSTAEG